MGLESRSTESSAWRTTSACETPSHDLSHVGYPTPENLDPTAIHGIRAGSTERNLPDDLETENMTSNLHAPRFTQPVTRDSIPTASATSRVPLNVATSTHHSGTAGEQRPAVESQAASNQPPTSGTAFARSSSDVKMDASFALLMMSLQQDSSQALSDDDKLWCTNVKPFMYPSNYPETLRNQYIRARIVDCSGKPPQTIVDMVTAVATVERWMWKKYSETRSIEDIPPSELDDYLTEFYPILRRPNGKEYDPKSLTNFKSRLDRFLKEKQYPCSINKSNMFASSQHAFAGKRRSIIAKRAQVAVRPPESLN